MQTELEKENLEQYYELIMIDIYIFQFNCNLVNHKITRSVLDVVDLMKHQILIIQEFTLNCSNNITYCSRKYILICDNNSLLKVCFIMSRQMSQHVLLFVLLTFYSVSI